MRVLVSGSSGLIGSALLPALTHDGHEVVRLVRSRNLNSAGAVYWNPDTAEIDTAPIEGIGAVVHLAGKNIASGRWTARRKQEIRDSRVKGTRLLCDTLARLNHKPEVLVSASAVGYYGHRGDELLREDAAPGSGFLAELTRAWENALQPAAQAGIRTVALRTGTVIARQGGALAKLLPLFKAGLGGRLGDGTQYMSWIALTDLVDIVRFTFTNKAISGALNAVAPHPVTNIEFTKALGHAVKRPTLLTIPAFALRLVVGELADEGLLASTRAHPAKLEKYGYEFTCPDLESALRAVIA